ncbi:MAG: AAA family ATPase [Gammaproteobacteria bacterium]|nr:AAA family ATPase [Gammaproteobacteria bacterium]
MGLITVQVKAHRVGALYSVLPIGGDGSVLARKRGLAVSFPQSTLDEVEVGTVWVVSGITTQIQHRTAKGFLVTEDLLIAKKATYRRLSRDVLAFWIQSNIKGIGPVIASRIARTEDVDQLLQGKDVNALCKIEGVNEARAIRLIENWPGTALMDAIEWLQSSGFPHALGKRLIRLFGEKAIDVLEANPFLLLSFGVQFEEVSKIARSKGVEPTSTDALGAIAAHVAWCVSSRSGSIGVERAELMDGLRSLIGENVPDDAPEVAVRQGGLVAVGNFGFATYGAASIEKEVAQSMAEAIRRKPGDGALLASWEVGLTENRVQSLINDLEAELPFSLYDEQRLVVVQSVLSAVACITGGAGTGKTTILRWILHVYEKLAPGMAVYQVALSGRAARRMNESTGREASTIARLVGDHLGEGKPRLPEHLLLVIDEASMVDLLSMFKLFAVLPKAARILFVGDSQQLPPVGPGLVFHSLIKPSTPVSVSTLSQVRRQGEASGILKFATSIRHGRIDWAATVPYLKAKDGDCHFDGRPDQERLFNYWQGGGGAEMSIVLTPVRDGEFGVDELNASFQAKVGHDRPALIWPECGSARIQ